MSARMSELAPRPSPPGQPKLLGTVINGLFCPDLSQSMKSVQLKQIRHLNLDKRSKHLPFFQNCQKRNCNLNFSCVRHLHTYLLIRMN